MGDTLRQLSQYSRDFGVYGNEPSGRFLETHLDEEDPIVASTDPARMTPTFHIQQAEETLQILKRIVSEPGWKKVLTHKSGVSVWEKPGAEKDDKIPVFKGEHVIQGFTPQAVFAVVGMRKLWDDWYEEGNLVENLNDTTSLTYMVMKGLTGSKARDLSLVEKIECTPTGKIYFVSTSAETPKVPHVAHRIRAFLKLHGWVLEPVSFNPPATKVTYIMQTDIKGWIPFFAAKKYLVRRPLAIYTIDLYLQKRGPPSMALTNASAPPPRPPTLTTNRNGADSINDARKKASFVEKSERKVPTNGEPSSSEASASSNAAPEIESPPPSPTKLAGPPSLLSVPTITKQSSRRKSQKQESYEYQRVSSATKKLSSLPPKKVEWLSTAEHRYSDTLKDAFAVFKSYVENLDGWELYSESKGLKIYTKTVPGKSMPILRGEAAISGGWTADDILATILDFNVRRTWDDRWEDGAIVERFDDGAVLVKSAMKGTFPISGRDLATVAKTEKGHGGVILNVGTSVVDPLVPENKKYVRANAPLAGWRLYPHFDSSGLTTSVDVSYIVDIDIKLENIPSSILKSISVGTPMCILRIDECIQKNGYPPYVQHTFGQISTSEFNTKTLQYDLTLKGMSGGVAELHVCKKMYPTGFDISIKPEGVKVELLQNNTEVVRITIPIGTENDIVDIKLIKQTSRKALPTLNGKLNIPIATATNGTSTNGVKKVQDLPPQLNRDLPPQLNRDLPPQLNRDLPPQLNRDLPPQLNRDLPPQLNRDSSPQLNRAPNKKQKQPAASLTRTPAKTFVKPSKVSYWPSAERPEEEPKLVLTQHVTERSVKTPLIDQENQQVNGDIVVNKPIKKDVVSSRNALRFNNHQVGILFASMLLAYYAGKLGG